jgi:CRP/FNR family transcriptional regulator, cyclic AMP receptor protein
VTATDRGRTDARGWANVLAEVPLFRGLSQRQLRRIASVATIARFHDLTDVVRSGEMGDAMYVVLDGAVAVRRPGLREVELGPGGFFGEMSLLDGGPRSATVVALGRVTCLRLTRPRFVKLLRGEPALAVALLEELSRRLRAAQASA